MDVVPSPPSTVIECTEQIYCLELSPFGWCRNLILVAYKTFIEVGHLKFLENNPESDDNEKYARIIDFHHDHRVSSIIWHPDTALYEIQKCIKFACADNDHKVRLITSDLQKEHDILELDGHEDYINSIAFDLNGKYLYSGSDDCLVKKWDVLDGKCVSVLTFHSQVVSVKCHEENPDRIMVALAHGVIHMVGVQAEKSLKIFPTNSCGPLSTMDWAPSNQNSLATLADGELLLWDISKSSVPTDIQLCYFNRGGQHLKFCPSNDHYLAMFGEPGHELKIYNVRCITPALKAQLKNVSCISWHNFLPLICAHSGKSLCFWKIP